MSNQEALAFRRHQMLEALGREIYQRSENVLRLESDVNFLEIELRLAVNEFNRIVENIARARAKNLRLVTECFYCAEFVSESAKVCPFCGGIFLEHAHSVYTAELEILRELGSEEV